MTLAEARVELLTLKAAVIDELSESYEEMIADPIVPTEDITWLVENRCRVLDRIDIKLASLSA